MSKYANIELDIEISAPRNQQRYRVSHRPPGQEWKQLGFIDPMLDYVSEGEVAELAGRGEGSIFVKTWDAYTDSDAGYGMKQTHETLGMALDFLIDKAGINVAPNPEALQERIAQLEAELEEARTLSFETRQKAEQATYAQSRLDSMKTAIADELGPVIDARILEIAGEISPPSEGGEYVRVSNKIEAIKFHRSVSGYGLKESKDYVEALLQRTYEASLPAPVEPETDISFMVEVEEEAPPEPAPLRSSTLPQPTCAEDRPCFVCAARRKDIAEALAEEAAAADATVTAVAEALFSPADPDEEKCGDGGCAICYPDNADYPDEEEPLPPPTQEEILEVLRQADEFLSSEDKWTKHAFARIDGDQVDYSEFEEGDVPVEKVGSACLLGSVYLFAQDNGRAGENLRNVLASVLQAALPSSSPSMYVPTFNDYSETTFEDAKGVLARAIAANSPTPPADVQEEAVVEVDLNNPESVAAYFAPVQEEEAVASQTPIERATALVQGRGWSNNQRSIVNQLFLEAINMLGAGEGSWIQQALGISANGITVWSRAQLDSLDEGDRLERVCLLGSITLSPGLESLRNQYKDDGYGGYSRLELDAREILHAVMNSSSVGLWNDAEERTYTEVMVVLRQAMEATAPTWWSYDPTCVGACEYCNNRRALEALLATPTTTPALPPAAEMPEIEEIGDYDNCQCEMCVPVVPAPQTAAEVLAEMEQWYRENPERWVKGSWARDFDDMELRGEQYASTMGQGIKCMCLEGAELAFTPFFHEEEGYKHANIRAEVRSALREAIKQIDGDTPLSRSFIGFNDYTSTTFEDVLAVIRRAREIASPEPVRTVPLTPVEEALERIDNWFSDESKWTKGAYGRDADGNIIRGGKLQQEGPSNATCLCIAGSYHAFAPEWPTRNEVEEVLNIASKLVSGERQGCISFNDDESTSFEDLKTMIAQARQIAEDKALLAA